MYFQIKDNELHKRYTSRPKWYSSNPDNGGVLLTDEELKNLGVLKIIGEIPDYNILTQSCSEKLQDEWIITADNVIKTYTIFDFTLEQCKFKYLDTISENSSEQKEKEITVLGHKIKSSTNKLIDFNTALLTAGRKTSKNFDWKFENGEWDSLSKSNIEDLANLLDDHITLCTTNEKALHLAVDDATSIEDLELIDIEAGWPGDTYI